MAWTTDKITATEVKQYAVITRQDFTDSQGNVIFATDAAFDSFLDNMVIPRAQAHVEKFIRRNMDTDYATSKPDAIKDAAARAAANILSWMKANKLGSFVQVGEARLAVPDVQVLSRDVVDLLQPWIKLTSYEKASSYQTADMKTRWSE